MSQADNYYPNREPGEHLTEDGAWALAHRMDRRQIRLKTFNPEQERGPTMTKDIPISEADMIEHYYQKHFLGQACSIDVELNRALVAYMAALDDPEAKTVALADFDSALVRLREVSREARWPWASDDTRAWGPYAISKEVDRCRRWWNPVLARR